MSTAMAPISDSSTRACSHTNSIAGASVSAWRRPRAAWNDASTPSWPPTAHPTCIVAVSTPRISTTAGSSDGPAFDGATEGRHPRRPRRPDDPDADRAIVVIVAPFEADLEEVGRQRRRHEVPPLDERDSTVVEDLRQPEVDGLLEVLQPVHVEVHEREAPTVVVAHEHERRAGDVLVDAEGRAEALGERRLARAEVAGEHDDVAGAGDRRDRARERLGVVDGFGACGQRAHQASSF